MEDATYDEQTSASPSCGCAKQGDLEVDKEPREQALPEMPTSSDEVAADEVDETTGASPGTAQACTDLGLNSLQSNLKRFNIKPPGIA